MAKKVCKKCGKEYDLEKFIPHKQCKDGYSGTCKDCANNYHREWKHKNKERLAPIRRRQYAQTKGVEVGKRRELRKKIYPLRRRAMVLQKGMSNRANRRNLEFDKNFFAVEYLMGRLRKNPSCECCGRKLDIGFKKDKKFNQSSPSIDRVDSNKGYTKDNVAILCWRCNRIKQDANAQELRVIADFIDCWGNEVESDIEL